MINDHYSHMKVCQYATGEQRCEARVMYMFHKGDVKDLMRRFLSQSVLLLESGNHRIHVTQGENHAGQPGSSRQTHALVGPVENVGTLLPKQSL